VQWRFGEFTLDLDARRLQCDGREVHLSPKAFDLLTHLLSKRPNVIAKPDLIEHLWPDTIVVEANLANLIAEVRAALDDRAGDARFIRTVHGVGYAFCGDAVEPPSHTGALAFDRWIEWGTHRFPLPRGEHIVGRDPEAAVRLDSSTVSRHHCRLIVNADRTVLEDFGSKNGTFVGDRRVSEPVLLEEGDTIRIGDVLVTYRVASAADSTDTYIVRR